MVSDADLIERLHEFLKNSDLNTTTTAIVRRKLEEDFGIDLSGKKAFIREHVDLFLQSQLEDEKEEEEEGEEETAHERDERESEEEVETKGNAEVNGAGTADNDEEDDNDGNERRVKGTGKRRKRVKDKDNKEGKKKGGGFSKLCSLSPQLKEFLGVNELPRTEVVKQIWAHIRECNLQDPDNRRNIICDEKLRELFRVESINMFQMNKVLSKHIWPLEDAGPTTTVQKKRPKKQEREEDDLNTKEKRPKGANTGFLAPLPLSEAMVKFFGTGESSLSRSDVVKRIWGYIKQNDLQDPSDKRRIICDEKLKELFNVDTFNGFTVPKLLTPHFIKAEQ